ncbi:MAG: hypothetical protein L6R30_11960 [Thermoanaerobaculia bacterium]|nr:hypothetical protein [Thermoanaerobaculia bacterium]
MTAPPETAPMESAIASLRTRVHVLQTARAAQLETARTAAADQAALESSLMKNLAAGTDTAKLEASLARAEAERAAALRKAGLLDPAIREAERALDDALRSDETEVLRLALEAAAAEIPRLREKTEQALRTLAEAFQEAHRLHVESVARLKRLESLAPGAPGFDLECSPHLSPGATLRPAEELLRQELYDANKRFVLIPVQVPLALD